MAAPLEAKYVLPPLDPAIFRDIFSGFPSGVTVVTGLDGQNCPVGLTVSAVMSVSLDPPLLAVCLQNAKYTLGCIRDRGNFIVNFLASDQSAVSNNFAFGDGDKFTSLRWFRSETFGSPILPDVRAHAECEVHNIVEAGDHTLIIGKIVSGAVSKTDPLAYCARQYVDLIAQPAS